MNSKSKTWTVAISGLGNIGLLYDLEHPDAFLTHTKGFYHHDKFEIIGLIDPDAEKRKRAEANYPNVPTLSSIEELEKLPDLIVLCSTPDINRKLFTELSSKPEIQHFLIEKPFWDSGYEISPDLFNRASINYTRKFLPAIQELREEIANGKWGKLLRINVIYSKGISNIGSHFIDLAFYLTQSSDFKDLKVLDKGQLFEGYSFSFSQRMKDHETQICFTNVDADMNFYEVDLIFEQQRIKLDNLDLRRCNYDLETDPVFKQTKTFVKKSSVNMDINSYALHVADYLGNLLDSSLDNISNLQNEKNIFDLIK
ncbi:MAG: Gfo/Idh/MocA family oxidoreductase, partial [Flavobacteriales bacterium]|nr:Gfo/Idh/MocA family oxidoreductase [Flavobacteriales bacterium]